MDNVGCSAQKAKQFDCACGDNFFEAIEEYQLSDGEKSEILEKLDCEAISKVIQHQTQKNTRLCNKIVKLHDIVAGVQRGSEDVSQYVRLVIKAILSAQSANSHSEFLASVLSSAFTNYRRHYQDILNEEYFSPMKKQPLSIPFSQMTSGSKEAIFKSCISGSNDQAEMQKVLSASQIGQAELKSLAMSLIFSATALENWSMYSTFICYLCHSLKDSNNWLYLKEALTLWSDPIIAKSYVQAEVIHYTKICLLFFSHFPPKVALDNQDNLIKFIAQGLPNHFSSSDHRSIQLAKYFCEVITESLKVYEGRSETMPEPLCCPQEDINLMLLQAMHKCNLSKEFASNLKLEKQEQITPAKVIDPEPKITIDIEEDDDDDDDLEPIETLEAPDRCKVAYLRDFLENMGEEKTYDETCLEFAALPQIVKFQLAHEHPQVGIDLLNVLVKWENDFDSMEMERYRKKSLCNALLAQMDGNVQHLCSLFPKESTRVPQQILILEILSTAASECSLANLQVLAKSAFQDMLRDDLFESREVPVRIPTIMFFHRLLSIMPVQMVRSEMVTSYLKALTCLKNVDKSTEQTISYSLHNLVNRLRDIQLSNDDRKNEDLSSRLAEMRSWLWQLQETPSAALPLEKLNN